ncbi:4Fe-4S dicluster domain-containing protein [Melioribacteraceae bacterium 4301-Me]|uniref:4Fe-4S dicluster domain-containing protein n=1 Tax=Pyranulibacter aquaticus TaxID=3163344 RepID=UPI003598941B
MSEEIKEIEKETQHIGRDEFLSKLVKIGAGTLAATIVSNGMLGTASKLIAKSKNETPVKRKYHYGMVIDTRRCVGCRSCVLACKAENKTPPGVSYTVVFEEILENRPNDKPVFMTKPCFHCEHPPCTDVCPVSATYKREQDGIVVVDYDRCIGCRYCMTACPYSARWFDFGENYPAVEEKTPWAEVPSPEYKQFRKREHEKSPIGNVRKCTFCLHLQDEKGQYNKAEGRWPACAKTCTGKAIHFGDFNDPNSEVSVLLRERQYIRLKEELGTSPNVYYLL